MLAQGEISPRAEQQSLRTSETILRSPGWTSSRLQANCSFPRLTWLLLLNWLVLVILLNASCSQQSGPRGESAERNGQAAVQTEPSRSDAGQPGSGQPRGDGEIPGPSGPPELTAEALERKDRSVAQLRQLGVPVSDEWQVSVTEATSGRRSAEEVARRAMALCVVGLKGEGRDQAAIDQLTKQYGIADALTPDERAFVADSSPEPDVRVWFAWRHESYWVLLWSLGLVEELGPANSMCDVSQATSVLQSLGRKGFIQAARLRPQAELLDAADLAFRAGAAVDDARRGSRPAPPVLDAGVVLERQRAMRWLIGAGGPTWDEVAANE